MAAHDVSGPNAAYVAQLLADYQDAPASVPDEWRRLFESGGSGDDAASRRQRPARRAAGPGAAAGRGARAAGRAGAAPCARPADGGSAAAAPAPEAPAAVPETPAPEAADPSLPGAVAAAMALVKAYRMHGHLAARLDPLGSEPMGDPALDETRLVPSLTPELQARIPAKLLRLYVEGDTLLDALPQLREVYAGSSAYEIEHISDHAERVWLRKAIESGSYRVRSSRSSASRCSAGSRRSRGSSSTCGARSSARSSSRSRESTCSSRCSTRRSSWRRRAARTRSSSGWRIAAA